MKSSSSPGRDVKRRHHHHPVLQEIGLSVPEMLLLMKKFGHDMGEGQLLALLETDKGKALVAQLGRQMKREKVLHAMRP